MKKLVLILLMLIPVGVLAKGDITVSPTSITLEIGEEKSFIISAYNTVGDVVITLNNTGVASINKNEWETGVVEEEQTKEDEVTVKGISVGKASIILTLDGATFDGEELTGQTRIVNINVIEKKEIIEDKPVNNPDDEIQNNILNNEDNINVSIIIKDKSNNLINNKEVTIYDKNDNLIIEGKTDDNGLISIKNITEGEYYLIINNEKIHFDVVKDNSDININTNFELPIIDVPSTGKGTYIIIGSIVVIVGLVVSIIIIRISRKSRK